MYFSPAMELFVDARIEQTPSSRSIMQIAFRAAESVMAVW
jgi:hypothetical protein